jgi:hypothetical protein
MVVFVTMITSSASSGVLLNSNGWALLNYLSIPFVALVMMSIVWLAARREVIPMKV